MKLLELKLPMQFDYNPNGVDPVSALIYLWTLTYPDGLERRYIGKASGGAKRPLTHYRRNLQRMMAGLPYRRGKPDQWRLVHLAMRDCIEAGGTLRLSLIRNVSDGENINDVERDCIVEHDADLNGRRDPYKSKIARNAAKMINIPDYILDLFQARLNSTAAARETLGIPNWKSRGFRYDLEDFTRVVLPERSDPNLIPMSREAAMSLPNGGNWREHQDAGHAFEHSVPLSVLFEELMKVRDDKDAIGQTLIHLFQIVWVTKDEDRRLNAAGLNRKMPVGWTAADGPLARYAAVGIDLEPAQ